MAKTDMGRFILLDKPRHKGAHFFSRKLTASDGETVLSTGIHEFIDAYRVDIQIDILTRHHAQ